MCSDCLVQPSLPCLDTVFLHTIEKSSYPRVRRTGPFIGSTVLFGFLSGSQNLH